MQVIHNSTVYRPTLWTPQLVRGWEIMNDGLREAVHQEAGRRIEPSAAIIDSQSVTGSSSPYWETTEVKGERGYDSNKKVKGRKRHIMVDVMGLLLVVMVHIITCS